MKTTACPDISFHPGVVEASSLLDLDLAKRLTSSQSSLNKASFFFLDHPFNCFSQAIAD
jgi:hypothetical protein